MGKLVGEAQRREFVAEGVVHPSGRKGEAGERLGGEVRGYVEEQLRREIAEGVESLGCCGLKDNRGLVESFQLARNSGLTRDCGLVKHSGLL